MTKYMFNSEIYNSESDVEDAICEYIYSAYPEIIHSDFICEESSAYEDLWDEVETIDTD